MSGMAPQVMHIPDVDWQTTVILFTDALTAVSNWSVANPTHTPIAFYVEVKNPATNTIASQVGQANTDTIDNLLASESGGPPYSCVLLSAVHVCVLWLELYCSAWLLSVIRTT